MSLMQTSHKKVNSLPTEHTSLLSNLKSGFLPSIKPPSFKHLEEIDFLNDDEDFREEAFSKKKNTIKAFMKKTDLKMININAKETKRNMNLIRKNASIQFINLSKKMFENALDVKKEKGSINVNELWSNNYYKKVMKFSNLKHLMDNILKFRRTKLKENRQKILTKETVDFNYEMDKFDPLSPFRIKREKDAINRRTGIEYQ